MPDAPSWLPWLLAALSATLALGLVAERALARAQRRWRGWRRRSRAAAGEREAERLLRRLGYRVEAAQAELDWAILVDDDTLAVALRADLIVSRGRRRFVAEVKTGQTAPSLRRCPATRRQLLEYRVAYDVDGALLVDMERERVREVIFPGLDTAAPATAWTTRLTWLLLGAMLGVATILATIGLERG